MLALMRLLASLLGPLALVVAAGAPEPAAFVTEVEGVAHVRRAAGDTVDAVVGGQLLPGDALVVQQGRAVLIYLTGRSAEVAQGGALTVATSTAPPAPLMGRIRQTLEEIVGPQRAAEGPVVQGMARSLPGIAGAQPANTRLLSPGFAFTWHGLEGVRQYRFTLEPEGGGPAVEQVVADTTVPSGPLGLEPGRRYLWRAQETQSLLPRTTGTCWVVVAPDSQAMQMRRVVADLGWQPSPATAVLLQAAALYQAEFYAEAESLLTGVQAQRPLRPAETRLLNAAYARMQRWEKLGAGQTEEDARPEPRSSAP